MTKTDIFYAGVKAEQEWSAQPKPKIGAKWSAPVSGVAIIALMLAASVAIHYGIEVGRVFSGIGVAILCLATIAGLMFYLIRMAVKETALHKDAKEKFLEERRLEALTPRTSVQ